MSWLSSYLKCGQIKCPATSSDAAPYGQPQTQPIGSPNGRPSILDAIYQWGKGNADHAIEKLAGALRNTSLGQKVETEVTKQKTAELMPFLIGGAVLLLLVGYFARSRSK